MTSLKRGLTILELTIILGVLAILAFILAPNFQRTHCGGPLTACKSNLKNLATALEMYASDNKGRYPSNLDMLTRPNKPGPYLKTIPTCPSAAKITYLDYQFSTKPDSFSFSCCGNNHGKAFTGFNKDSTNYPKYSAVEGLIDHP